jgi:hypothetical protein
MASEGPEKSPREKYDDALQLLAVEEAKLEAIPPNQAKRIAAKQAKIEKVKVEIAELEPLKDFDTLSSGAKIYLKELYAFIMYGKWAISKDSFNKYTAKGREVEEEAIQMVSLIQNKWFEKNEITLENEYITGTPDIIEGEDPWAADFVRDIKNAYDTATFFCNLDAELKGAYYWQMQGYFALTGAKAGEVNYCLLSVPETIINDEKIKLAKKLRVIDIYTEESEAKLIELEKNLSFDDIPMEHRMLPFPIERNDEDINRIYSKVKLCREYLSTLHAEHMQRIRIIT